ncbi:MAG: Ig-like domain-containing protein [Bacteroidia bacterium]
MYPKRTLYLLGIGWAIFLTSCIGTDIIPDRVDPELRISNPVDTIGISTDYQYEASYFNTIGLPDPAASISWESSNPDVIAIDENGLARAVSLGNARITASVQQDSGVVEDFNEVAVGESTVNNSEQSGTIQTTSSYKLTGDFVIRSNGDGGIDIVIADNYEASTALPGLYLYLTNNPNTVAGAKEIGKVQTFKGAHQYTVDDAELFTYSHLLYFCKPFNVKVGDGAIN